MFRHLQISFKLNRNISYVMQSHKLSPFTTAFMCKIIENLTAVLEIFFEII